jgi:hypothetical protein
MTLLSSPNITVVNSSGQPYAMAKMYTYRAGTLTNLPTYTSATYAVAHANPIIANASGVFPPIFINPDLGYDLRVIVKDSLDVAITGWDLDNIPRSDTQFSGITVTGNSTFTGTADFGGAVSAASIYLEAANPRIKLTESDAISDKKAWDVIADANALSIRTRTDIDGAGKNILVATRGTGTALSSIDIGNATDVPVLRINGTTIVAADIAQSSSGSFTATLSGFSGTVTGTVNYKKTGGLVTLYTTANIGGTSNSGLFGFSGIPAALWPATSQKIACSSITDNGNGPLIGQASISNAGTCDINLARTDVYANQVYAHPTGFTSSGLKLLNVGWSVTYSL